jgi:subtilisin family serine protease
MLRYHAVFGLVLSLALLGGSTFSVQSAPPEPGLVSGIADRKLTKVSHDLHVLRQEYQTHLNQADRRTLKPSNSLLSVAGNRVVIDAVASGDAQALLADLEALSLQRAAAYGRMVSGQLPIDAIAALDALDSLKFVWPAYVTSRVGTVDSQGDVAMNADDARTAWGVDGTGITVGTLSDSYDHLGGAAGDVASSDLPAGIAVLDDTGACLPCKDEGRAMMQIIADVAPGADQAFHTASNGRAAFAQGIEDLAAAGADVILDDIGYFSAPFFQDGIVAQAVDKVVGMGVAYFSAAGNDARQSYESPFRSSGITLTTQYEAHDFDPGPGVDELQSVTIPMGASVTFFLQWDEPVYDATSGSPGASNDLDIFLFDDPPTTVVASSTNANLGADPVEAFAYTNPGPGTDFILVIAKYLPAGGPDPDLMKIIRPGYAGDMTVNEWQTDSSTIFGHPNADGAIAVGSAWYHQTPEFGSDPAELRTTSSAGGTPILFATDGTRLSSPEYRSKPFVVAPDGGNTTFFGADISDPGDGSDADTYPNFFGTSAAAPHAAAVAALLREADASLTPTQVTALLADTARDMDGAGEPGFPDGFDDDSGYGLIDANAALTLLNEGPDVYYILLPAILRGYDPSQLLRNSGLDANSLTPD